MNAAATEVSLLSYDDLYNLFDFTDIALKHCLDITLTKDNSTGVQYTDANIYLQNNLFPSIEVKITSAGTYTFFVRAKPVEASSATAYQEVRIQVQDCSAATFTLT